MKNKNEVTIRSSAAEYLTYIATVGDSDESLEMRYELLEAIHHTDETGEVPRAIEIFSGKEKEWDYRDFDLEYCNVFFKDNVLKMQYAYE